MKASLPNIILILADDMGYGDFGVFNKEACTPALDDLAAQGMCLSEHYSASVVCAPARAGLLTGRYPHRTGVVDVLECRGLDRLALDEVTLADVLSTAGYTTGLVGKWHLGALDLRYHPNSRGFDEFVGFSGAYSDYWKWTLDRNRARAKADGRYLTDVITDESIAFLRRHHRSPFFLHVAYNAPHFPFQAPEEEISPFLGTGMFTRGVSTVYGMIRRLDRGVQRILEQLRTLALEENTLVIFTSDNGPQFGGDGDMDVTRFNLDLAGSKGRVYEGGIKVPAVIRWPGHTPQGRTVTTPFHFTDWFPTLAEAAGVCLPSDLRLDGKSLSPLLNGEPCEPVARRYWQWNRYRPLLETNAAIRDGRWKLVRPPVPASLEGDPEDYALNRKMKYEPDSVTDILRTPLPYRSYGKPYPLELYDLERDPGERDDLAGQEPDRVSRLQSQLTRWFAEVETDRARIES
jgi:arylsulfatase A